MNSKRKTLIFDEESILVERYQNFTKFINVLFVAFGSELVGIFVPY